MPSPPRYVVRAGPERRRAPAPPPKKGGGRRSGPRRAQGSPFQQAARVAGKAVLWGAGLGALAVFALGAYAYALAPRTPDAFELSRATRAQPTVVFAAGGEKLTQFEAPFREWVPLDSMPAHLVRALIATEDRQFYRHGGIDVRRTVGAAWYTLRGQRQGGSTITQQLARNLFPAEIGRAGTAERKVKEAMAAVTMERTHAKRDILEAYLNTVPFLYNAHGVELAARTYFGTTARELSVPQSAMLVAMLKGPAEYNPVRNPARAKERRDLVLRLMAEQGEITAAEASRYAAEGLGVTLRPQPGTRSLAPHFTAAVRARLEAWARPRGYDVERDGLVVHTTLDLSLHRAAEEAVAEQGRALQRLAEADWGRSASPELRAAVDGQLRRSDAYSRLIEAGESDAAALAALRRQPDVLDGARRAARRPEMGLVALDPASGAVRAYVGSRDFAEGEYDHAGVARRQPGSTFKPFVYAAALQRGYAPSDAVVDRAVEVDMGGGDVWRPRNSGAVSGATLTLADALAYSKNTVTVQIGQEVGPARVAHVARQMGITSRLDVVPSLVLGTSPVTLLEMTSAYGTIANDGMRQEPVFITRIESASGRVIQRFSSKQAIALTRRDARALVGMLRGAVDRGTGRAVRTLGVTGDVAGKTGTTQRNADGWFILMHPKLVAGAWAGFPDQRLTFRAAQGSQTALPAVAGFFRRVQGRLGEGRFPEAPDYGRTLADYNAPADSLGGYDEWGTEWAPAAWEEPAYESTYEPASLARPEVPDRPQDRPADRPAARPAPRPAPPESSTGGPAGGAYTPAPLGETRRPASPRPPPATLEPH